MLVDTRGRFTSIRIVRLNWQCNSSYAHSDILLNAETDNRDVIIGSCIGISLTHSGSKLKSFDQNSDKIMKNPFDRVRCFLGDGN